MVNYDSYMSFGIERKYLNISKNLDVFKIIITFHSVPLIILSIYSQLVILLDMCRTTIFIVTFVCNILISTIIVFYCLVILYIYIYLIQKINL